MTNKDTYTYYSKIANMCHTIAISLTTIMECTENKKERFKKNFQNFPLIDDI